MAVGTQLKRIREINKLSAREFADYIGLNVERLRKWESNGNDPKKPDLDLIEEYFKKPIEDLEEIGKFKFYEKKPQIQVKGAEGQTLEAMIRLEAMQLAQGAFLSEIYAKLFDMPATKALKQLEQMGKDEARKLRDELR